VRTHDFELAVVVAGAAHFRRFRPRCTGALFLLVGQFGLHGLRRCQPAIVAARRSGCEGSADQAA
jgi:hypothetical protein